MKCKFIDLGLYGKTNILKKYWNEFYVQNKNKYIYI